MRMIKRIWRRIRRGPAGGGVPWYSKEADPKNIEITQRARNGQVFTDQELLEFIDKHLAPATRRKGGK